MPRLVLHHGREDQTTFPLHDGPNTIGRTETNDVFVLHKSLSRQHARIWVSGANAIVEDLGSKNGTQVDGARITRQPLTATHTIRCGELEFLFLPDHASAPQVASPTVIYDVETDPVRRSLSELLGAPRAGATAILLRATGHEDRSREKLQILLKVSQLLSSPAPIDALLERVLELALDILDIDRGLLLMLDEGGVPQVRATRVRPGSAARSGYSRHIVDHVLAQGTAALFADARSDPRVEQALSIVAQSICTCMCVPLKPRDKLVGVLYVDNLRQADRFGAEDLEFLSAFANQAAIAIDHALLSGRLAEEAVRRNNLQRFFPPSTIDLIVRNGGVLTPVETQATALFSDISGYTELSSRLTPREVISLLNVYFPPMADIVFQHEGTLEKYIGDALLALWGAPFAHEDDAARALRAAVDMQKRLAQLVGEGALPAQLRIHIGINTGIVAAGNIGSGRYLQYATIGDATNVASRICGAAKDGEIVVDERTAQSVGGLWPLEPMGPVQVKGKSEPLTLFRVKWT